MNTHDESDPDLQVRYELSATDYGKVMRLLCTPPTKSTRASRGLRIVGLMTLAYGGAALVGYLAPELFDGVSRDATGGFLAGAGAAFLIILVTVLRAQRRAREYAFPRDDGYMLTRYTLELKPEGVEVHTPHWFGLTKWSGVAGTETSDDVLLIRFDGGVGYGIPRRAFSSPEAERRFVAYVSERRAAANGAGGAE